MRAALLFAALLAAPLGGCEDPTSVLLRIDASGLEIPTQLAALRIRVSNPELDPALSVFDSQTLNLCGPGEQRACHALPLSVLLHPGAQQADALVRAEVIGADAGGAEVLHDAAQFRFTQGRAETLDIYLSTACLGSSCATQNRICGPNGGCIDARLRAGEASPDLGGSRGGTIERWSLAHSSRTTGTTAYSIDVPAAAQPGDLIIALIPEHALPPTWQRIAQGGVTQLVTHRVDAGEGPETYRFQLREGSTIAVKWMAASYRGVSQAIPGPMQAATVDQIYDLPSVEVSRAGSVLTTWFAGSPRQTCTEGADPVRFVLDEGSLDEEGPLAPGPTGARRYACQTAPDSSFAAQLLLSP